MRGSSRNPSWLRSAGGAQREAPRRGAPPVALAARHLAAASTAPRKAHMYAT